MIGWFSGCALLERCGITWLWLAIGMETKSVPTKYTLYFRGLVWITKMDIFICPWIMYASESKPKKTY